MWNHRMPFLRLYGSGLNFDLAIVLKLAATCGPFATKRHRVRQKTFLCCDLLDVLTIPTRFPSLTLRIRSLVL
jgi:hypothetical protein